MIVTNMSTNQLDNMKILRNKIVVKMKINKHANDKEIQEQNEMDH